MSQPYQPRRESTGPQPRPVPTSRLRADGLQSWERTFSLFMHLSPLAGAVFQLFYIAPLVMWLVKKDESHFVDDHGREILNFMISFILLHIILIPIALLTLGLGALLYPALWVVGIIAIIRGAIAASNGEFFRYPVTFRFIS